MNKKKIKSYDDLLEEKQRLEQLLASKKEQISADWLDVKREFEPVNNVFAFLGKFTKRDKSNPLLNAGLNIAGDLVLRRYLLARFGWVTRAVVPILLKNYSSNVFADKGRSLVHKIKHWFRSRRNGHEPVSHETGDTFS